MPNLNKLLNKVNQASQAIKSAKGIKSKIESIGYKGGIDTSVVDQLQEIAEANRQLLEERRTSLQKQISNVNTGKSVAKKTPKTTTVDLQYPLDGGLDNYIVFRIRPRKDRSGGNFLADKEYSIALYIPDDVTQSGAIGYKADGVGAAARGFSTAMEGETMGEKMDKGFEEIKNAAGEVINKVMNTMSGGVKNLKAGQATNPMQEQFLEGVDFRSHSFEYEFMPKNEKEAQEVQKIITVLRLAGLPDTFASEDESPNENFFNYPNIFDVSFEGPIKDQVEGFLPMVMTECTVSTFGGNSAGMIADSDGKYYPAKTGLSLSFAEIRILSQETYAEKVSGGDVISKLGVGQHTGSGSPSILDSANPAEAPDGDGG